jgi:hypothetical protein
VLPKDTRQTLLILLPTIPHQLSIETKYGGPS